MSADAAGPIVVHQARPAGVWPTLRWLWGQFWARAPRQLQATRQGKIVIGVALAVGAAAINTGSNLLFLGWGLSLSAIVLSGILSEATLKVMRARVQGVEVARAGHGTTVALSLENVGRVPAYAVEAAVVFTRGEARVPLDRVAPVEGERPFLLRVEPSEVASPYARTTFDKRGAHRLAAVLVRTSYPFGFFAKSRRFDIDRLIHVPPMAVSVEQLAAAVRARAGVALAGRRGVGEDFFSLRPYRDGDDVRTVAWRASARSGRWVVRETEAQTGQAVHVCLPALSGMPARRAEWAIAVAVSLCEQLLASGMRVGFLGPGQQVRPGEGERQRRLLLEAGARLDPAAAMPVFHPAHDVAVVRLGQSGPSDGRIVHLALPDTPETFPA